MVKQFFNTLKFFLRLTITEHTFIDKSVHELLIECFKRLKKVIYDVQKQHSEGGFELTFAVSYNVDGDRDQLLVPKNRERLFQVRKQMF